MKARIAAEMNFAYAGLNIVVFVRYLLNVKYFKPKRLRKPKNTVVLSNREENATLF